MDLARYSVLIHQPFRLMLHLTPPMLLKESTPILVEFGEGWHLIAPNEDRISCSVAADVAPVSTSRKERNFHYHHYFHPWPRAPFPFGSRLNPRAYPVSQLVFSELSTSFLGGRIVQPSSHKVRIIIARIEASNFVILLLDCHGYSWMS